MHYEFKAPQQITSQDISFSGTNDFNNWLNNLTTNESPCSFQEILYALQTLKTLKNLNTLKIPTKELILALDKINIHLTGLVQKFEAGYWKYKFPLSSEQFPKIELIAWTYAELANNYHQITIDSIKKKSLFTNKKKQALLLYKALQATSQVYLKISSCYAQPYKGFWTSLYQLFFLAEENSLLKTPIDIDHQEKTSVELLFKHILLFNLCDTHQFRPRDMKQVYTFLSGFAEYTEIHSNPANKDTNRIRAFSLKQDSPLLPIETTHTSQSSVDFRYFMFADAVNEIFSQKLATKSKRSTVSHLNKSMFLRAYKSLSSTQKRQLTRITKKKSGNGVIGLEDIIKFHTNNKQEIKDTPSASLEPQSNFDSLGTTPSSEDLLFQALQKSQGIDIDLNIDITAQEKINYLSDDIFLNSSDTLPNDRRKTIRLKEFEILNSTFKGYQILWSDTRDRVQIGNVFGMIIEPDQTIEVGLIRRMSTAENGLILGIELLSIESLAVSVCRPDTPEERTRGVLLNQDSLLFSANHLQPGDEINLIINSERVLCHLGQSLHSTSSVTHFEVVFTDEQTLDIE